MTESSPGNSPQPDLLVKDKLKLDVKVIYGIGDVASQAVWGLTGTYLTIFYTDVVGIAPAAVAGIMLIARIWDGINDPMFGMIAERTRSRFGRFRPYMIFGTPVLVLSQVLCFTNPGFGSATARVTYAGATYIILGMVYTVVNMSYGALSTVMTYDPVTRTELNTSRMMGSGVGGVILGVVAMPMIVFFSGGSGDVAANGRGYLITATLLALVAAPGYYLVAAKCKEIVVPVAKTNPPLRETLKVVVTNRALMVPAGSVLLAAIGLFGRMGVVIYYYQYAIQRVDLIPVFLTVQNLVGLVAMLCAVRLIDKIGKKQSFVIGQIGQAAVLVAMYFTDFANIPLLMVWSVLLGLCNFCGAVPWSMVPEAIDWQEDRTGVRADGTSYAVMSLATKMASAFGSVLVAVIGAFGYVANAEQTAHALNGINIATNLIPAGVFLVSAGLMMLWPLNLQRTLEIKDRLMAKRAASDGQETGSDDNAQ